MSAVLCRDCSALAARSRGYGDAGPLPGMRLAAGRRAPRTGGSRARPSRLRRLLCDGREAQAAGTGRSAGDRRRRRARRRAGLLLCRAALWRALGDADVQGARRLSRCGRDPPGHGEISRGRPRGAGRDAPPDAAGRAALDRRGVSRSERNGGSCTASRRRRPSPRSRGGSRRRSGSRSRSASATTSFSPSSPPISTSRAVSR